MKRTLSLLTVAAVLLLGCSANLYKRVEPTDIPVDLQDYLYSYQDQPGAVFAIDPNSGAGYLQVSVGAENQLSQHLKFVRSKYHAASKMLTVHAEQYTPEWGKPNTHIGSADWLLIMKLKQFDFNVLMVVIEGAPGEKKVYVIERAHLV